MTPANPIEQLTPAWNAYKKASALARDKIHKAYTHQAPALRMWLEGEAITEALAARQTWLRCVIDIIGESATIEWQRNACIVNGTMYFA